MGRQKQCDKLRDVNTTRQRQLRRRVRVWDDKGTSVHQEGRDTGRAQGEGGGVVMTALTQPEGERLGTGDDRVTAAQREGDSDSWDNKVQLKQR